MNTKISLALFALVVSAVPASAQMRNANQVPPGHRPPAGMCRVWVDGVPPGRQPAPTSCANAQRDRVQYGANARVIYGDDRARPGNGRGRHGTREGSGASGVLARTGSTDGATAKRKVIAAQKSSGTIQKSAPKGKEKGKN